MTVRLLPNVAALTSQFLRDQEELESYVDDRVFTILPASKVFPLVRVTRAGGSNAAPFTHWLDAVTLQVDVWADTAALCFTVTETCRSLLATRMVGAHDYPGVSGVVTSVAAGGIAEGFDPDDPRKARDRFDVVIHAHPVASATSV